MEHFQCFVDGTIFLNNNSDILIAEGKVEVSVPVGFMLIGSVLFLVLVLFLAYQLMD